MRILRVGVTPLGTVTGVDIRIAFPSGVNVLPLLQHAVMAMLNGTELDGFALNAAPSPQAPAAVPPAAEAPTTQEPPVAAVGASTEQAPQPRRRRAHQNPLGETAPAASEPTAQAPATSRRRRTSAPEAPAQAAQAPAAAPASQYPDLELSKAASEAAAVLSPAAVTEFLRSFNVQWVGQLKPEQRGKFVIGLQEKMKLAQAQPQGAAE